MQHEISKHSKKVWNAIKKPNTGFLEKVKEVGIEIFIIVFAVTLSIWLHSWSEHRHNIKKVKEFAIDLKSDLKNDTSNFQRAKQQLTKALDVITPADSLQSQNNEKEINIATVFRFANNGNYEGFKSSGNIGLIENKQIKKALLNYYQQLLPAMEILETTLKETANKLQDELKSEPIINRNIITAPKYHKSTKGYLSAVKTNIQFYDILTMKAVELDKLINTTYE
jgi:hypothetical protein